jgi:5-methylthioadenosine/S-adenosylhomocysteine deaminase
MMDQEHLRPADMLIVHGLLVTFDQNEAIIKDGAIAITGGEISGVGQTAELLARFQARKTIDASNHLVMPGLINTHTHSAMTLFRGLADDLQLEPWLARMRDAARKIIRPETVTLGAELAFMEMILGGTTTALDMYFFPEMLAAAAKRVGIRLVTGPVFVAHEVSDHIPADERLARGREFIQAYADDPLVIPCVMPHSPDSVPLVLLEQAQQLAEESHALLSIHAAETRAEVANVVSQRGCPPVEFLDRLGMLSPRAILAHCIHLTDAEITLLSKRGAVAAHCPVSNLKLGDGVAPIPQMLNAGVQVTLGTDGPASSNDLDLWKVLRVAAILHRGIREDPRLTPARRVLRMVTIDAAKALGVEDRIGSLQIGKRADLILIDLNRPHLVPVFDIYSLLAYAVGRDDVSTVVVNGQVVVRDRQLMTCDKTATMAAVREIASEAAAIENGYGEQ